MCKEILRGVSCEFVDEGDTCKLVDVLVDENRKLRETLQRRNEQLNGMTEMWVERGVENAKLREFASEAFSMAFNFYHGAGTAEDLRELKVKYCELGVEGDG